MTRAKAMCVCGHAADEHGEAAEVCDAECSICDCTEYRDRTAPAGVAKCVVCTAPLAGGGRDSLCVTCRDGHHRAERDLPADRLAVIAWAAERAREAAIANLSTVRRSPCARCGYDADAAIGGRWSFLIRRDPPSLNHRLVNSGDRRFAYRTERDVWRMEFRVARVNHRIPLHRIPLDLGVGAAPRPGTCARRRVTLERVFGGRQRERDYDNLCGGMKAVVDALVAEQLIGDDTAARAEIHYRQRRVVDQAMQHGLQVTIEDLA